MVPDEINVGDVDGLANNTHWYETRPVGCCLSLTLLDGQRIGTGNYWLSGRKGQNG